MTSELPSPPAFWRTVLLLLGAARARAAGRRERQRELLHQRTGKQSTDWGVLGVIATALFMVFLSVAAAFMVCRAVEVGQRSEVERQGKTVVSAPFLRTVASVEGKDAETQDRILSPEYPGEADRIAERYGGSKPAIQQRLQDAVHARGARGFIAWDDPSFGVASAANAGISAAMLGSIVLVWWVMMLACQGEGLELDLQRRRHPMWEWLFSHPAPPGAIFLAEMLSPIAANPIYWSAPVFAGVLYGSVYGFGAGVLATVLAGVPITIAAACLGKALEIGITLRFPLRSRGAMIGLMSWFGYASMMLFFIGFVVGTAILATAVKFTGFLTIVPWPWLRLFLGLQPDGSSSFVYGIATCGAGSAIMIAGAIWFSIWGTQQGLAGVSGRSEKVAAGAGSAARSFGKDPLYRKELLWFIRDRSAIIQTILIPLTVAGFQLFNFRDWIDRAQGAWNYLCGTGILFGTYFLWVLGPKSLSSEGSALWISLTWPRGLESLLKAKAWLWSLVSTGIVALVLGYAAFLFPGSIWKIALVGIGWFFFSQSMAEKTVTLVSVPSESGERDRIPWTRRGAAQLGMLTFCIGVLTQQWHLAVVGIVYSYITAAAMWESFRARLPYLYDPWAEKVPPPPTLMHAMVSISLLVEGGAVITGIVAGVAGRENIAIAQAIGYAICAVAVSIGVSVFLRDREVSARDVWLWPRSDAGESGPWWWGERLRTSNLAFVLLAGAAAGIGLGLVALVYMGLLEHIPAIAEMLHKSREQMAKIPHLRASFAVMAIGFAPVAEEYLFRGLLFRALDREWGGWRAILGSAAFFAIYHPPLSWLPVALLGAANAILFKKTGRLAPAVVLHMVYNAVVLS